MALGGLPNIGAKLEEELTRAGVKSPEELKELGAKEAFIRLRMQVPDACINRLYALAGAAAGVRWHQLPREDKAELKKWYDSINRELGDE